MYELNREHSSFLVRCERTIRIFSCGKCLRTKEEEDIANLKGLLHFVGEHSLAW